MVVRSMVKSEQTGGTGHREGTKATTLLPSRQLSISPGRYAGSA